jgi:hypothetical protein
MAETDGVVGISAGQISLQPQYQYNDTVETDVFNGFLSTIELAAIVKGKIVCALPCLCSALGAAICADLVEVRPIGRMHPCRVVTQTGMFCHAWCLTGFTNLCAGGQVSQRLRQDGRHIDQQHRVLHIGPGHEGIAAKGSQGMGRPVPRWHVHIAIADVVSTQMCRSLK